jgi:hypothetical protein
VPNVIKRNATVRSLWNEWLRRGRGEGWMGYKLNPYCKRRERERETERMMK